MHPFIATLLIFFFALPGGWSQLTLGRQVIGASAINGGDALQMSTTVGEPAYRSAAGNTLVMKAGFEQADPAPALNVLYEVVFEDCWSGNNGSLQVLVDGCGPITTLSVTSATGDEVDANALGAGEYAFALSTAEGCSFASVFEVVVPGLPPCELVIYNLVTPNGDGLNDRFVIEHITLPEYASNSVRIFNRWGQEVWSGERYDNIEVVFVGRDLSGRILPEGSYFYEVQLDGRSFTGHLTLLQ